MKLGIVGAGMIVKDFLKVSDSLVNSEVSAICGVKEEEENLKELSDKYNIENIYFSYEDMLKSNINIVYVGLPNNLHFDFAKKALENGKSVIVEKPFTTTYSESVELANLARKSKLYLFEAITTLHLPNFKKIKELLPQIGDIKIVQCNYSQYSKRYQSFKEGNILPVFNPNFSGGALMDINIYNLHYIVGLFGKPLEVKYYPNIEKNIDTSGVLILNYKTFQCVSIGAKDCQSPVMNSIQGDEGVIIQKNPTNSCREFELLLNNGEHQSFNENNYSHRMINEFEEFIKIIEEENYEKHNELLDHSLLVSQIQTEARKSAGIIFPADK